MSIAYSRIPTLPQILIATQTIPFTYFFRDRERNKYTLRRVAESTLNFLWQFQRFFERDNLADIGFSKSAEREKDREIGKPDE